MKTVAQYAPGARVEIRDEEWLVKATLQVQAGSGAALRVVGISELVRNHEAVFLTDLEKITELKPEETTLVADTSPQFRRSKLYLESLLRRTPPTDEKIYLGHRAAMNDAPYQLEPAHQALSALRPRILIADGVGLGKTIEVGVLLSELIRRGRGERILVVAIRSMLAQFQEEMWARFAIPLVRLDSVGLQRLRAKIPANKNPFYYYNRVIISVDTLKNDAQYRHYLEQTRWDVIVIDECHNVANSGSARNRLAGLLARTGDSLILTSATPHNGRPESFANLMNMLEPTSIADPNDYTSAEIAGLFVRRFKKDIEAQVAGQFSKRKDHLLKIPAGAPEETFFAALAESTFHTLDRGTTHDALYRVTLLKSFLSSPAACLETIAGRLSRIERRLALLRGESLAGADVDDDEAHQFQPALLRDERKRQQLVELLTADAQTLTSLRAGVAAVTRPAFSKFNRLVALLRQLRAVAGPDSPRVLIFSERIATLEFLQEQLIAEFNAHESIIPIFHAGLPDVEQTSLVESFGKEDSPIRILLASDVASEGVNLHHYCHLLIHFDIPWSLITLEQRNGRVDRYGQHQSPHIHYLLTVPHNPLAQGDLRVLDRLIEKEQEAHKNIGDAATIMGLHDAQKEEQAVLAGVAAGLPPEQIIPDESPEADWLAILLGGAPANERPTADSMQGDWPSLYADDLAFARAAFAELHDADPTLPLPEYYDHQPGFALIAPDELRRRCEFIPREAIPADWQFRLTTDRQRLMERIKAARKQSGEWPAEQLFWELHPVMDWLLDRLLVRFGRHEAPVIIAPPLAGEAILLFQGTISNRRGQPVITRWFGLRAARADHWTMLPLAEVLARTGLGATLPNPGEPSARLDWLRANLPAAVAEARAVMSRLRAERGQELGARLREDTRKLQRWHESSLEKIAARRQTAQGALAARLAHEQNEVEQLYRQRQNWLTDSFTTEDLPYLRLVAAFVGK